MKLPYRDCSAKVNGVTLHYQDWGDDALPALLLVHGITMQSHFYDPTAMRLRERFHCISIDLRGHGDSEWSDPKQYIVSVHANDVLALMDTLKLANASYIGTSMGGRIALQIATKNAERLWKLVLNDITPEPSRGGIARILQVLGRERPPFPSIEAFVEEVMLAYLPRLRAMPMDALVGVARWSLREVPGGLRPKFDPEVLQRLRDATDIARDTELQWEGLRKLQCPILLLRGEESDIVLPEVVGAMQQAKPAMRFAQIPGAGHVPSLMEPASIQALDAFLQAD